MPAGNGHCRARAVAVPAGAPRRRCRSCAEGEGGGACKFVMGGHGKLVGLQVRPGTGAVAVLRGGWCVCVLVCSALTGAVAVTGVPRC